MNCETCIYFKRDLFEFPCVCCTVTDLENLFNYYTEAKQLEINFNQNETKH